MERNERMVLESRIKSHRNRIAAMADARRETPRPGTASIRVFLNDVIDSSFDSFPEGVDLYYSNGQHAKLESGREPLGWKLRGEPDALPVTKGFVNDDFPIDDPIADGEELDFEPAPGRRF